MAGELGCCFEVYIGWQVVCLQPAPGCRVHCWCGVCLAARWCGGRSWLAAVHILQVGGQMQQISEAAASGAAKHPWPDSGRGQTHVHGSRIPSGRLAVSPSALAVPRGCELHSQLAPAGAQSGRLVPSRWCTGPVSATHLGDAKAQRGCYHERAAAHRAPALSAAHCCSLALRSDVEGLPRSC